MKCQSNSPVTKCRKCGWKNEKREWTCAECGEEMRCQKDAVDGYTLCDSHGGPAPNRNFYGRGPMDTGSTSAFPITRLAATYNKQVSDGVLLSNRASIDLIDTRIKQLLERVDIEEAPDRVAKLYELWNDFKSQPEHSPEWLQARVALDDEFKKVYHDYKAWEQIFQALDLRGKSIEREVKTLQSIKAMMTAEDGYHLSARLLAASMKVIGDDPKKLKELQYEYAKIIGESSDRVTEGVIIADRGGSEEGGGEA